MKAKFPLIFIICLSVAGMMWGLSGVGDVFVSDPSEDLNSPDEFNDTVENSSLEDGMEGSSAGSGDGDIIGLILNGGQSIIGILRLVLLLPLELQNMGFPRWFAWPIGLMAELITIIGLFQLMMGRQYE